MDTVWDLEPDVGTPAHDPVDGKIQENHGGGGVSLGIFADLAFSIGNLVQRIDRQQELFDRAVKRIPADYPISAAGVYPSSGNLLLSLGSPDLGQLWVLRRLIIGGSDITTTPAGTGWLFVSGSPPNQNGANSPTSQLVDFTSGTLPQKAFYGTHEVVVDATQYVYVVVTSGTNGTQYVATGMVEVFDQSVQRRYGA